MKKIVAIITIFLISVAFIGLCDTVYAKGGGGGGKGGGSSGKSSSTERVYSPTTGTGATGSSTPVTNSNKNSYQKNFFNIIFVGLISFLLIFLWFVLRKPKKS
ncbi:hypothetical protein [Methanobacterium formicicum]|uniref:Uncharacterized protein n=1 Tax=Methanobacterium formicicum (strain DSM 3637 / PP1) TaxID=1204725 RepID=K2QCZ8_METFP|nr:hypothetical protein [Methanobacterium formicicum]EKF85871.1 hypothetical protein A994_07315 [Methanobacterium formicicum DSM 3637]